MVDTIQDFIKVTVDESNPDKIQLSNLPPLLNQVHIHGEANPANRVIFIIRKPNLFVIKTRYRATGTNKHSKREYSRWKTLSTFTAAINSKNRLNLFVSGHMTYSSYMPKRDNLRNVTRHVTIIKNTYIGVGARTNELLNVIRTEFAHLYDKNGLPHNFYQIEDLSSAIMSVAYPGWYSVLTNFLTEDEKTLSPPLYTTEHLRFGNEFFIHQLLAPNEEKLKDLLYSHPKHLGYDNIFLLALTKKRLTETQRISLISQTSQTIDEKHKKIVRILSHTKTTPNLANGGYLYEDCSSVSFENFMTLRAILKKIPEASRFEIVKSDGWLALFSAIAKDYRFLKNRLDIEWTSDALKENSWKGIQKSINKLTDEAHNAMKGKNGQPNAIIELNRRALLTPYFTGRENHPELISINIPHYSTYGTFPGRRTMDKGRFSTNAFEVASANDLSSPRKGSVLPNPYIKILIQMNLLSPNKFFKQESQSSPKLTYAEYVKFYHALLAEATQELNKHKLPVNDDNLWTFLASQHAAIHHKITNTYKDNKLPSKWFSLLKQGHSPENILLLLEKKITLRAAKDSLGISYEWLAEILGKELETPQDNGFF